MDLGANAIYTITSDKIIFNIIFEYISNLDMYSKIAYKLPIKLATNVLIIFTGIFSIISQAYIIMQFINKFSRKIISRYIVTLPSLSYKL